MKGEASGTCAALAKAHAVATSSNCGKVLKLCTTKLEVETHSSGQVNDLGYGKNVQDDWRVESLHEMGNPQPSSYVSFLCEGIWRRFRD